MTITALEELVGGGNRLPLRGHIEEVDEKVVGEYARAVGEDTVTRPIVVCVKGAHTSNKNSHLGGRQRQQTSFIHEDFLGEGLSTAVAVVGKPVGDRLQILEGTDIGKSLGSVVAARREADGEIQASRLGGRFNSGGTTENDEISHGDLLRGVCHVELGLNGLQTLEDCLETSGIVGSPGHLRFQLDAATVGTSTLVRETERGGRPPSSGDEVGNVQALGGEDLGLERSDVIAIDHLVVGLGYRVLPEQKRFVGDVGSNVASNWPHVPVEEFVYNFQQRTSIGGISETYTRQEQTFR